MTGVLWGLLGATLIGMSDCIARVTAERVPIAVLLAAVMGTSTLALTVWCLVTGDWPRWHAYAWAASAASGLLTLVALLFLYRALVRGPISVASPAASAFSVMLVVLNAAAGQPFAWSQGLAILLVFGGVAMLARRDGDGERYDAAHLRTTALLGLSAAAVVALRMFLAQDASDALGVIPALYLNRTFAFLGALSMLLLLPSVQPPQQWSARPLVGLVLLQAILETLALASFLVGSSGSGRVGASIGFAAFAATTAIAAWIWLGEAIGWRRGIWMAVVAAGIMLAIAAAPG